MSGSSTWGEPIRRLRAVLAPPIATLLSMAVSVVAQPPVSDPVYPAGFDPESLARLVDGHLVEARTAVERLVAVQGPRTAANTLRPFSDAQHHMVLAGGLAMIAVQLHPDTAVRVEGLRAQARIGGLAASVAVDPRVARAFEALDTAGLTPEERLLVVRARRDFRRAGADRDEAVRDTLRARFEALERLSTAFGRNITEDTTTFLASPDGATGMPPDWIATRPRDGEGRLIITASYEDFFPVLRYAADRSLRRRAALVFANRGWPANAPVLDSLLLLREATARLVGYPDWATYQAETRMAGSVDTIRAFIELVSAAAAPARERLASQYLERLREDDPSISRLALWDRFYATELVRREEYALDGREVRAYFPFESVRDGLLGIVAELFGLEFRRVDLPVWHPSVEAYEAREDGRLLGHFYLDLHPRPGKYSQAGAAPLRIGIPGRQLPAAVLMTNVPGGEAGDPGLMEHSGSSASVTTFFHEFGHVLHFLYVDRPYMAIGFEQDFVEAPSQMMSEWAWQSAVLRRITRHVHTGEPIPDELVRRMQAADAFDRPMSAALEAAFATISLRLHEVPAALADPDSVGRWAFDTYLGVELAPDMHLATSFDHLGAGGYSASYYTYLWSQVIVKDLWSAFDPEDPLDPEPARRYRDLVLRPGGSRPAAELVRDLLGRPFGIAAWKRWLEGG